MKKITTFFLFWVAIIYALSFLSSTPAFFDYSYESTAMVKENLPTIRHLLNFDGGHYQNISRFGYIQKFQTAFFPLYPSLVKLLSIFTKSHLVSALFISLSCTYLSLLVFTNLFKKPSSIFVLMSFPLSFFFLTGYTESLFLLLSLLSWYSFKQEKYLYSGIAGFFASLSRFYGVLLLPSLLLEFFLKLPKNQRLKPASYKPVLSLLLIPFGLVTYMGYLDLAYQDPLSFIHALSLWSKSTVVLPPQTIYRYYKMLTTVSPTLIQYWIALLEILSLGVGLLASFVLYKQKQFSYSLYLFLGTIIPSFTGTLQSLPRYLLVLFPIYFIKLPKILHVPVLVTSLILQIVLLQAFLAGKFIA